MKAVVGVALLVHGLTALACASTFTSYHVGNSLTWNLLYLEKFASLSDPAVRQHTTGHHIRASSPLCYMWANPTDITGADPSTFDHALVEQQWDTVTLQPYPTSFSSIPSTLASDTQVINDMMALARTNPANASTRFYIYAAWPAQNLGTYASVWTRTATSDPSQPTMLAREYFQALYDSVTAQHPDVYMIPAGESLFAVDQRILNGEIPGLSGISELYADSYHLNDLGCHVIAAATYATMFGESPVGLTYSSTTNPVSPETLLALQQTVWNVVTTQSYTGVPEPTALAGLSTGVMLLLRRPHSGMAQQA